MKFKRQLKPAARVKGPIHTETTETWTLFPELVALRIFTLFLAQRFAVASEGGPRGSTGHPSGLARGGGEAQAPRPSGPRPPGGDALARVCSMVARCHPGPHGPVARGRADRRSRSPSCAARLASAILDAAAAAASASSSVFAARGWFLRPKRRGGERGV